MGREKKEKEEYRQCNISLHCQPITIMFSVISPHLISLYCYNIEGWSILIDYQCKVNLRLCMSFKLEKKFSNIRHLLAGLCNSNWAFFAQVSIFFIFNGFCSYLPYFLLITYYLNSPRTCCRWTKQKQWALWQSHSHRPSHHRRRR
jgi:hypothetical protein